MKEQTIIIALQDFVTVQMAALNGLFMKIKATLAYVDKVRICLKTAMAKNLMIALSKKDIKR